MSPLSLLRLLWLRGQLLRHDHWTRARLQAHQARALEALRVYAYARSRFYQRFHRGLESRPLAELPVLTKAALMERFDDLVSDPSVRLEDAEAHLARLQEGEHGLYLGRYRVNATSGSTGRRGLFLYNSVEWLHVLASYARSNAWGGAEVGLTRRMRTAVVSTTVPWHQSAMVGASVRGWFVPTLCLDAADPLPGLVERLNAWQPRTLVAYASTARSLAVEQLEGRLKIAPKTVFSASEVLTDEARKLIARAWGSQPFDVYGATETAAIASECEHHEGLHLFEDLVITEVVDQDHRPVPPGEWGDKVLVTVLFSRTQPLIRYEMSDRVRLAPRECPSGKPYAMIGGIQGRLEEVLHLPAATGGEVAIHPNVFHEVMDRTPTAGWQVVHDPGGLRVLLVGQENPTVAEDLAKLLREALSARGAAPVPVAVSWADSIPKSLLGKAPLVKSNRPRADKP